MAAHQLNCVLVLNQPHQADEYIDLQSFLIKLFCVVLFGEMFFFQLSYRSITLA
jgi:hypothetical protein